MQSTRIALIRHGETAWNVGGRIQGQLDIELNDKGRWQARQTGQALRGQGIQAIYASDLFRAYETALAVGQVLDLDVGIHVGLRERAFGEFQGWTFEQIAEKNPEASRRWRQRDPSFAPEGGETLQSFYDRCVTAVNALAARHLQQTIAVVAHGGVLDALYRAATRVDLQAPRTWQIANASINWLLFADGHLNLVGWGDVSHLEEGALDEQIS